MNSLDDLPAVFKTARKARGLTQAELAAKAHVSRSTILQLENGTVTELGFRKLAAALQAVGLELSIRPLQGPLTLNQLNQINALEQDNALRKTDALVAALHNDEAGSHSRRGRKR
jgi:transcriptional regulator with XRE-family HTH domain